MEELEKRKALHLQTHNNHKSKRTKDLNKIILKPLPLNL